MTSVTLYGLKVAESRRTKESEHFVALGVKHHDYGDWPYPVDHKQMLQTYRSRHVRKTAEGIYRQHSSMIETGDYELELLIHHDTNWNYNGHTIVTYHEEEYEIPDGKVWYVLADNDDYSDGTDIMLYFSTFAKACELYHADPEDLEDDPFDFHRLYGIMNLGYIGIDDEAGESVLTKYLRGRDE